MSNNFQITGKIHRIGDVQTFGSGFTKREFVVEVEDGKYPQLVKFEAVKDNVAALDGLRVGAEVSVSFNLRGNEYNGKFFTNLVAWKVSPVGQTSQPSATRPPAPSIAELADDEDDIPF